MLRALLVCQCYREETEIKRYVKYNSVRSMSNTRKCNCLFSATLSSQLFCQSLLSHSFSLSLSLSLSLSPSLSLSLSLAIEREVVHSRHNNTCFELGEKNFPQLPLKQTT